MTVITGLNGIDWLALFAASFGLGIAVLARRSGAGRRVGGFLVAPLLIGAVTLVIALVAHPDTLDRLGSAHRAAIPVLLAVVAAGFVFADFIGTRVMPLVARRNPDRSPDVVGAVTLAVISIVGFLALGVIELKAPAPRTHATRATTTTRPARPTTTTTTAPTTTTTAEPETTTLPRSKDGRFQVVAVPELPGAPLGIAVDAERDLGYLTLGEGTIVRFRPSSLAEANPEFVPVADGLEFPRGVVIVGDELVVSELGPLLCVPAFPRCQGEDVPGVDPSDRAAVKRAEAAILAASSGKVLAYRIDADGGLSDRRVLIDGLPVADSLHGVNALTLGPDGHVYLAIGNLDRVDIALAATVDHPQKTRLGTVLEFLPDGTIVGSYATGLRNVYQVAFAPDGRMWGVDNDGPTPAGWRDEELLQIKRGADYGFPFEGSFTHTVRTDDPLFAMRADGSAGLGWVDGVDSGLMSGSCGKVSFIEMTEGADGWVLPADAAGAVSQVLSPPGCVTGVVSVNGTILLTAFRYDRPGQIFVLASTS
jgi:hypothetical protein